MASTASIKWAGLVLSLLLALSAVNAHSDSDRYRGQGEQEREREREREHDLRLEEPREVFRSEGGHIRMWDRIRALEEADVRVQAARITLRNRGLMLPGYSDSACIAYVEQGEGLVGFLTGYSLGESVRRVRRGDVIAFPRGVAHWYYNSGDEDMRILGLADTSAGIRPGQYTTFYLVGGRSEDDEGRREWRQDGRFRAGQDQELRGILHGFGKEFLAEAWNMDERQVEEMLDSQRDVAIVRAEREIDARDFPGAGSHHSRRAGEEDNQGIGPLQSGERRERQFEQGRIGDFATDFVYNVHDGTPDVRVQDAGHATVVDRSRLPLLAYVGLGLAHGRLERDAMFAPHWSPTGHRILHILRGDGHLEIAGNSGQRLLSTRVMEGEVYVIPRFHPAGIRAGQDGLEWVSFYTTDVPYVEALAGKTSVLKNLPDQVAAAAFNVDEETIRDSKRRRRRSAILLPPSDEDRREERGDDRRRRRDSEPQESLGQYVVRYLRGAFF